MGLFSRKPEKGLRFKLRRAGDTLAARIYIDGEDVTRSVQTFSFDLVGGLAAEFHVRRRLPGGTAVDETYA